MLANIGSNIHMHKYANLIATLDSICMFHIFFSMVVNMLVKIGVNIYVHKYVKFPLTPMGVLAHRLRTLDRSLVPLSA